jgi:hypothetical protein
MQRRGSVEKRKRHITFEAQDIVEERDNGSDYSVNSEEDEFATRKVHFEDTDD